MATMIITPVHTPALKILPMASQLVRVVTKNNAAVEIRMENLLMLMLFKLLYSAVI